MYRAWDGVWSRKRRVVSGAVCLLVTAVLFLYNWTAEAVGEVHTMPVTERSNIYMWVRQGRLTEPQLHVIAGQTGVKETVVEGLLEEGKWPLLLELQGAYYMSVKTENVDSSIVTISEYLVNEQKGYMKGTQFADLRDGDILITKNSRFLGWRNGHAGLVVDAGKGLVLEAIMLGTNTRLCSVEKWLGYPAFQVLRLKEEFRAPVNRIVACASEYMVDVPYRLLAGIRSRMFGFLERAGSESVRLEEFKGTQCAHLVWYAYMQAGIDLDSDGGLLVTPTDIQNSPFLEVVQNYGY